MADERSKERETFCSFCGRSNRETGMHVEGPRDVYLCERCVGIAADIYADQRAKRGEAAAPAPKWSPPGAQPDWTRCTFCGLQRPAAGPMLEGPFGIHQCFACVDRATKLADEIRARRETGPAR